MKKIKLYAIGDSLTLGFPFEEKFSFPSLIRDNLGCEVQNLGVNGQSSEEILYRVRSQNILENREQEEDTIGLATILCGSNDFIFQGAIELKSLMNTLQIATYCKENQVIPLIISPMLCNSKQAKESWIDVEYIDYDKVNESIKKYEAMLKEACEDERFNFHFMSLEDVYKDYAKFVDGLHPDKEGYKLMAREIEKKILKIIGECD